MRITRDTRDKPAISTCFASSISEAGCLVCLIMMRAELELTHGIDLLFFLFVYGSRSRRSYWESWANSWHGFITAMGGGHTRLATTASFHPANPRERGAS